MLLVIMVRRGGLRGLKLTWSMIIMDHKSLWEFRSMPFIETFLCTSIMFLRPPSLPSVGLKSCKEICFQYFSYFFHEFFFYCGFVLESNADIFSALHRKLTAQSEMNLFRNCLVFTLLYFTILALSPFTFPECFLSPKVTKLEEGGVLFSSS